MQRTAAVWTQTAIKNGAKGTIICGDLNATWTGKEAGGQTVLERWAGDFRFINGLRQLADKQHLHVYTRGGDGQPHTWIDHILHKGDNHDVAFTEGYVSHAPEWEGLTDHWPLWGTYAVHAPAQKVPKQAEVQKVRWELKLTDRQKVDEFVEHMERYGTDRPGPTADSSLTDVMKYMNDMQQQMARKVKQLYLRAGQGEQRSSHKDGWSPVFIGYKAQLTALVLIRRHLMGHRGARKWTSPAEMREDLDYILPEWDGKLGAAGLRKEELTAIHECTQRPLHWWRETTTLPTSDMVDEDRSLVKRCLQGNLRREYRRNINKHVRLREDNRRQGRWRQVLNSVLGHLAGKKRHKGIDLNVLESSTGEMIGEPVEAHKELTGAFRQWFTGPDWCQGRLHEGEYFAEGTDSADAFLRDTQYTGVPDDLRHLIHRAITRVPKREVLERELKEALAEAPSLDEFTETIRKAKVNSSAGQL